MTGPASEFDIWLPEIEIQWTKLPSIFTRNTQSLHLLPQDSINSQRSSLSTDQ